MPLSSTDVYENRSAPHSSGTKPPIIEPMKIPSQIRDRISRFAHGLARNDQLQH
jgi:hypothetical protein